MDKIIQPLKRHQYDYRKFHGDYFSHAIILLMILKTLIIMNLVRAQALPAKLCLLIGAQRIPLNFMSEHRRQISYYLILGFTLIKTHITRQSCQELLLWVCLSPLDMVGHEFGPQSREVIDMIYHLDCQIEQFMDCVSDYLKRTDVLYVLTADHGVSPIPEIMNEEGYCAAHRINYAEILPDINSDLKKVLALMI